MKDRFIKKGVYGLTIFIFFTLFSSKVIGQQYLWTTNSKGLFPINSEVKVIPKEEVLNKLLNYYENYRFYYDYTGFTKDGFLQKYGKSIVGNDKKKWDFFKNNLTQISELSISSIKGNLGNGSVIMIFIVNKNNFDMIVFSNEYDKGNISTYNSKLESERESFIKFYKSLLNE